MDRAAVFDVDGTLADTNHLHVTAWWEAFRQSGHRVEMWDIHRALGLPSHDLVTRLLGDDRDTDGDETVITAHKVLYGTFFDRLAPLERAPDLLRELAESGWKVVLATSAAGDELAALRRAIDADDAITATTSADDVEQGKPAPEPIEQALELAGVSADRAVFIGDSVWDMKAATAANVVGVGVLSGGIPRADLEKAGARAVYRNAADLLEQLGSSPIADIEQRRSG
ncbi:MULTISPECIES: HAD family hydrolase [unclassified Streptomyces]|uniref:HAD family hydrolase n=1 Tax=unclassified Streptomyces TaxID=2593676 RepID=UPI00332685DF